MGNELVQANENNLGMVIDSREVAEMCEKEHKNLIRDIRNYSSILGETKIEPSDFFVASTYINSQNKEQPCYLLTKKGCDMVANKMTGAKGIVFTARYVTKFEDMEKQLLQPKLPTTYKEALLALVEQVELTEKLELENKTLVKEVEYKEDVILGLTKDITLQEKRQRLGKIVKHGVRNPKNRWNMLYDEFDKKFHIDTKRRYTNALERGEIKKVVNRLGYICDNLGMTNEIYDVACKIFEGDFINLLEEWRNNIAS